MFVKDIMSPHPITIAPETSILGAQRVMRDSNVRHLPVVNGRGELVGLVTRTTLEEVRPSKLTTLSVYELHYQLEKLRVRDVMVRQVVTVSEDETIERAARTMSEQKIGCLPVMRGKRLAGIVTDTDLTRTMLELLGARQPGVRMTLKVQDQPGEIARMTSAIAAEQGDITALGMLPGDEPLRWWMVVKVRRLEPERLEAIVKGLPGFELVDIRTD